LLLFLSACEPKRAPVVPPASPERPEGSRTRRGEGEPDRVEVRFVLVSFRGRAPGVERGETEAKHLAEELLEQARNGADLQLMSEERSDWKNRNTLGIANYDVRREGNELPRDSVAPRIGEVAFRLKPGEVGMAEYDPRVCPRGWYILQRTK